MKMLGTVSSGCGRRTPTLRLQQPQQHSMRQLSGRHDELCLRKPMSMLLLLVVLFGCMATIATAQQAFSPALEQCRMDLLAADESESDSSNTNDTLAISSSNGTASVADGYLVLSEYEVFVNDRYYANCAARVRVAESISQWQAFTSLACTSCLREELLLLEEGQELTELPDCCLPFNNSRIEIASATTATIPSTGSTETAETAASEGRAWLTRICDAADAAAVADSCYTVAPTSPSPAQPPTTGSSSLAPATTTIVSNTNNNTDTSCDSNLVLADTVPPLGVLSLEEYTAFLQLQVNNNSSSSNSSSGNSNSNSTPYCSPDNTNTTVATSSAAAVGNYATLSCASCFMDGTSSTGSGSTGTSSTSSTSMNDYFIACCTNISSGISILGASSPANLRTPLETEWVARICATSAAAFPCPPVNATVGGTSNSTNITTTPSEPPSTGTNTTTNTTDTKTNFTVAPNATLVAPTMTMSSAPITAPPVAAIAATITTGAPVTSSAASTAWIHTSSNVISSTWFLLLVGFTTDSLMPIELWV